MRINRLLSAIALVFIACSAASSQEPAKKDCPVINVTGPSSSVVDGNDASFSVNISGSTNNATYNWSISNGTIASGQGTPSITIETKGLAGQSITATVEIGGLPPSCTSTGSQTIDIILPKPQVSLYSKADYSTVAAFNGEIDKFATYVDFLELDALTTKVVILYPGKDPKAQANLKEMDRLTKAAFQKAGMYPMQFSILTGGRRDKTCFELFTVPSDAKPPIPDPMP